MNVFSFDNSFAQKMEGFYADWSAAQVPEPSLLCINHELADQLNINLQALSDPELAQIFSGNQTPQGAHTLAQVYAGHQFGGFSSQLGDGRALLLGEVRDDVGNRYDIQLKGSGRTPFSRNGDGKAGIGPVLREYLVAEAMHALGVPTTRALAAVTTGEKIYREAILPGAVLTRVAASHIRVGTFQFFASRSDFEKVKQLADYVIWRHYPDLRESDEPYLELLRQLVKRQARLIAKWMSLGFIHGVMNTDNMTLSGETIDYGPCAFLDHYDPHTVFSSIDEQGRYAYGNQPMLAQWNLARFAETLVPLIDDNQETAIIKATDAITAFNEEYLESWTSEMRKKLGLQTEQDGDDVLAAEFLETMEGQQVDFTNAFRALTSSLESEEALLEEMCQTSEKLVPWLLKWQERLSYEPEIDSGERAKNMNAANPVYIPRNHKVEEALEAATNGDLDPFKALYERVTTPFDVVDGHDDYASPAPDGGTGYRTFCGT